MLDERRFLAVLQPPRQMLQGHVPLTLGDFALARLLRLRDRRLFETAQDAILILNAETGTILEGITRSSIMELCGKLGHRVEERPVTIDVAVVRSVQTGRAGLQFVRVQGDEHERLRHVVQQLLSAQQVIGLGGERSAAPPQAPPPPFDPGRVIPLVHRLPQASQSRITPPSTLND